MIYENNCNAKTYLCLSKTFLNPINALLNKSIIMVLLAQHIKMIQSQSMIRMTRASWLSFDRSNYELMIRAQDLSRF